MGIWSAHSSLEKGLDREAMGAKRRVPIPEKADPAVQAALRAFDEQASRDNEITWDRIEVRAGLAQGAFRDWCFRHNRNPRIGTLRKVLNELGLDLVVVPKT